MKKEITTILLAGLFGITQPSGRCWAQEEEKPTDPASSRMVYGPTALPNDYKGVKLTAFDLGFWTLDYAPNSNITVGLQTVVPIGVYSIGGALRGTYELAPELNIGLYANGGILSTSFGDGGSVAYYGGGPMLTWGNSRRALNVSVLTYGASWGNHSGYAVLPGIGGSLQVSDRVKLNLEGYLITTPGTPGFEPLGAILYGVRIFSEKGTMFGDISFLAPIAEGFGEFYQYMPLGIPILAFGFSF